MKEEKYIIEKAGRANPFRVPDGYFDTLAAHVMDRVDREGVPAGSLCVSPAGRPAKVRALRPVYYAAASVCALLLSAAVYLHFASGPAAPGAAQAVAAAQAPDDGFDEAADYVMLDNQDIYACLSSDY